MKHVLWMVGIAGCLLMTAYVKAEESQDPKVEEARTIPLTEIVTTSPQKGLRNIDDVLGPAEAYNTFMARFRNVTDGSSNAFLVDAIELRDALNASSRVLFGSRSADTPAPVNTPNAVRGRLWLVAYLGSGPSNPTWWTIESVRVAKGKVVLNYHRPKPQPATADVWRYLYWIPLGNLQPASYEVQLIDADTNALTLLRRVEITGTVAKGDTQ